MFAQLVVERGHLHEIRARGGDEMDDFRAQALEISMPAGYPIVWSERPDMPPPLV
jgi:hypothetical protein